jgi:hypothetical protein
MTMESRTSDSQFVNPANDLRYEVEIKREGAAWRVTVMRIADGLRVCDALIGSRNIGDLFRILWL